MVDSNASHNNNLNLAEVKSDQKDLINVVPTDLESS